MIKLQNDAIKVYLPDVIGGGYGKFWRDTNRYRVLKGGKGSKKSATTALNYIYRLMKYPESNLLVVRGVMNTHRDSTFAQLKWAQEKLMVSHLWRNTVSPMEMTYLPTGQKILFRGFDDVLKLASTTVSKGYLCWVWIEEAFEIGSEADFDKLDLSIPRGNIPEYLFKQTTLTFNPWSDTHWLKKRFFDKSSEDISTYSTNYLCNEFLDETDKAVFERMKNENYRKYTVAGLGEWGIAEGLVFENWETRSFDEKTLGESDGTYVAIVEGEGSGGFVANELNKECDTFEEAFISAWEYIYERNPDLYSKTISYAVEDYDSAHNNAVYNTELHLGDDGDIITDDNINDTRSRDNVISNQRAVDGGGQERQAVDRRTEEKNARSFKEDKGEFLRRTQSLSVETSGRERTLLKHDNSLLSYIEKESDNSIANRAVQLLNNARIKAIYCDGDIETNQNGVTVKHSEALTAPDGTVFVSSNATLSGIELALHESVHSHDRTNTEAYADYEAVICDNINFLSDTYISVVTGINHNHYGDKYDIENPDNAKLFVQEIAAYINQFVMTNPQFAEQLFGGMFLDWNAVVEAAHKFNSDIGLDIPETSVLQSSANEEREAVDLGGVDTDKIVKPKKISIGMSEEERYAILKDKKITLSETNTEDYNKAISNYPDLLNKKLKKSQAEKLLKKVGEEFELFSQYNSNDIELSFEFGKNNLGESVSKQKGNYDIFTKMLSCFSDIINNAVGIEAHNRNIEGYKEDPTLKQMYVLCGAFLDGDVVIPVKLEIKEFSDKPNRLYVAVALEGINKDRVVSMGVPNNRSHVRTSPVTISISEILKNVNSKDKDFIKYIPRQFFQKSNSDTDFEYADNDMYSKDPSQWSAENKNDTTVSKSLKDKLASLFGKKNDKKTVSISQIVKQIEKEFNIPVSKGKFREKAYGIYKNHSQAIRTKISNALPTIAHELGHHLDNKYGLRYFESIGEPKEDNPSSFSCLLGISKANDCLISPLSSE